MFCGSVFGFTLFILCKSIRIPHSTWFFSKSDFFSRAAHSRKELTGTKHTLVVKFLTVPLLHRVDSHTLDSFTILPQISLHSSRIVSRLIFVLLITSMSDERNTSDKESTIIKKRCPKIWGTPFFSWRQARVPKNNMLLNTRDWLLFTFTYWFVV